MKPFEYASPGTESEALELLNDHHANTALLAGGTDLISLMKSDLVSPARVVDIKNVGSMQGVIPVEDGLLIGSLTTLDDLRDNPAAADYASLLDAVDGVRAIQIQSMGTLGGDLCHLPNCWYFRNGYGLLGMENGESLVEKGDNRYHAILGNQGPAKFVSASRFAPALIAWGARVRIIGPDPDAQEWLPLEFFYQTPRTDRQGVTVLRPGQIVSHIWLPPAAGMVSATYEVLQMEGLDWPLASAGVSLEIEGDLVRQARIVLGHVAPTPWVAHEAARSLVGQSVTEQTAGHAAEQALVAATPLSENGYKVQLARTAVKRALLKATNQWKGDI